MSWPQANRAASQSAIVNSTATVMPNTILAMPLTSPTASAWVSVCSKSLDLSRICLLTSNPNKVAAVIMPKPPNWNNTINTTSPVVDQWVAVSTTTSPVTHTADVAVNKAVKKDVSGTPGARDTGSISKTVPSAMAARKIITSAVVGWVSCPRWIMPLHPPPGAADVPGASLHWAGGA